MENFTLDLFGLESKHLSKCSENEKSAYRLLAIYFIVIISFTFLSLFYFFYLLTLNYTAAFFLTMMLSFVFFSIIRFSLLTIQLPLGESITWRKVFFNGATIFRSVVIMLLIFTLVIPFSAFLYRNKISGELEQFKSQLHSDFVASKKVMQVQQLASISELIDEKRLEKKGINISENDNRLKKFKIASIDKKIQKLEVKLEKKANQLVKQNESVFNKYKVEIEQAGMPFKRFELMFGLTGSIPAIIILFLLLFMLLPFYMYVRYSPKFRYSHYFGEEMISIISQEYATMKKECDGYLYKKYSHNQTGESLYEDPPFNRVRRFKAPLQLMNVNLFDHFDHKK
jgi:hypothetical protein